MYGFFLPLAVLLKAVIINIFHHIVGQRNRVDPYRGRQLCIAPNS